MLRKFAAVVLASSMIAGAAFAAQPSGGAAQATPAATTGSHPGNVAMPTGATKSVKHLRKHVQKHDRKYYARSKFHVTKEAHHLKGSKAHKAHVAGITKSIKFPKAASTQSAKLPATRSSTN
jgi:hypothetical protein